MNTGEIVSISVNGLLAFATLLAVLRPQRNRVSFEGTPVDKTEYEKHLAVNAAAHDRLQANSDQDRRDLFAKIGGVERGATIKIEAALKDFREFVENKFSETTAEQNENQQRLSEKLSRVGEDVAALAADVKQGAKHIERLDSKIDQIQRDNHRR